MTTPTALDYSRTYLTFPAHVRARAAISLAFVIALSAYEAYALGVSYSEVIGQPVVSFAIAAACLAFAVSIWASLSVRRLWRVGCLAVFGSIVAVQYGYAGATGAFVGVADLEVILVAPNYWAGAVGLFWNWKAVVPVGVYLLLLAAVRPPEHPLGPGALAVSATALPVLFAVFYPVSYGLYPVHSVAAFSRTLVNGAATQYLAPAYRQLRGRNLTGREAVTFKASTAPRHNIVVIIDESVRADNLGFNGYARDTTPFLSEFLRRPHSYNWGVASAAATTSIQSNRLLLAGVSEIPDRDRKTDRWPTVFQYAKAAGFSTTLVNGQTLRPWSLLEGDAAFLDYDRSIEAFGWDIGTDTRIARWLGAWVREHEGQFIVVNKRGIHWPYDAAYLPEGARWTPLMHAGAKDWKTAYGSNMREQITNSYDNAIRWNVDGFFAQLFRDAGAWERTYVLYTSDHGQSLSENGEPWPHGGPGSGEASVPMVLISPRALPADPSYRASHFNIMATLLDLMGIPDTGRRHTYPPSLLRATGRDSAPRTFLYGNLNGLATERWGVEVFEEPAVRRAEPYPPRKSEPSRRP